MDLRAAERRAGLPAGEEASKIEGAGGRRESLALIVQEGVVLRTRCPYCGRPFSISREEAGALLAVALAENARYGVRECPFCRRGVKIGVAELRRAAPAVSVPPTAGGPAPEEAVTPAPEGSEPAAEPAPPPQGGRRRGTQAGEPKTAARSRRRSSPEG